MDATQKIHIRGMERQIIYSIQGGFYYTARKQLQDLMDYIASTATPTEMTYNGHNTK